MPTVADTIFYLNTATIAPTTADHLRTPVAEWLEEIIFSPAIEQALNQIPAGTGNAYKSRRAMILILCGLNNVPLASAKQAVAQYADNALPAALGKMLQDVERVSVPRRLLPASNSFLTNPSAFLAINRVRTTSGALVGSGPTAFDFSWAVHSKMYLFEPPGNPTMHITVPNGFNLGTTKFQTIGNLGQITGEVAQGSYVLTTQLSGCSIIYSVNAGNLVVAHVWPDAAVDNNVPLAVSQAVGGSPRGVVLGMRMIHEGGFSNPVVGGTFGVFGMVDTIHEVGLRNLGPANVRMHGYTATYGHAYFIAVLVNGSWVLFGQQNNLINPAGGVSHFQQLYP
jgi:hypothetical protein